MPQKSAYLRLLFCGVFVGGATFASISLHYFLSSTAFFTASFTLPKPS